jgi:hypothetical protein
MPARLSPFELHFEIIFLENYGRLKPGERKAIDKGPQNIKRQKSLLPET